MLNETETLQPEALSIIEQARGIVVADSAGFERGGEFLATVVKPMLKKIEETFRPITRAQDAAKAEVLKQRKALEDPLLTAEATIKGAMSAFAREQERLRIEAEKAAIKAAVEEQIRLAVAQEAAAEALADTGDVEAGLELLEAPAPVVLPVPVARELEKPKAAGISIKKSWGWAVMDEDKIPRRYMIIDAQAIGKIVRSLGPEAEKLIPGISVSEEIGIGARAR